MKIDVHARIQDLADEQGLSLYELAKRSNLPLTSIYNMNTRKTMPRLETLEKICDGLKISMSEFFADSSDVETNGYLTENEKGLLEINRDLNRRDQKQLFAYAKALRDMQKVNKK